MSVAVAIAIGTATAISTATTIDITRCQGRCMSKRELAVASMRNGLGMQCQTVGCNVSWNVF